MGFDMNIIDCITRNEFLKKLYPNGLPNKLIVGRVELFNEDRIYLHLEIDQKPDIDVAKWGAWNKDYNVVSIELICQFIESIDVVNWTGTRDYFDFSFSKNNSFLMFNLLMINQKLRFHLVE